MRGVGGLPHMEFECGIEIEATNLLRERITKDNKRLGGKTWL
jgi:hypothetical protein